MALCCCVEEGGRSRERAWPVQRPAVGEPLGVGAEAARTLWSGWEGWDGPQDPRDPGGGRALPWVEGHPGQGKLGNARDPRQ